MLAQACLGPYSPARKIPTPLAWKSRARDPGDSHRVWQSSDCLHCGLAADQALLFVETMSLGGGPI